MTDRQGHRTIAAVNALVLLAISVRPTRRLALTFAALILALLVSLYVERATVLTMAARFLAAGNASAIPTADLIVVLGGDADTRPFLAADLYRRHVAPVVVLFEHRRTETMREGLQPSDTDLYRRALEAEGVPGDAIRTPPGIVDSTWDEAAAVSRMLPRTQATRLVVVTSPEHGRRALWTFRKALAGMPVDVRIAAAPHDHFDEHNWWRDEYGLTLYLHEFMKLPYYFVRYGL